MTSKLLQYDIYDVIGIAAWQTMYAMLRQIFSDITDRNPFKRTFKFSQTNNFSQVTYSELYCLPNNRIYYNITV